MIESKTDPEASAPTLRQAQGRPEPGRRASDSEAWRAVGVGPHGKGKDDPDVHKGAVEGDRPDQPQNANPHGSALNEQGLPDDPIAIAEDTIGANEDESQG